MSRKILPVIIAILVIGALICSTIFITKSRQIPENPPETIGNSSGNLNNQGLFCEHDGTIYFANTNDNHYLYRMNLDGSDVKRIADVPVSFINVAGDYVYFYYADQGDAKFMGFTGNMRGVYRISIEGKDDLTCLDRCTSGIISLIGNKIFYEHYDNTDGMTLYATSLDGKDKGQVLKEIVNPACVLYGNIYYPDQNNMFALNEYTPGASSANKYLDIQMYNPTATGDYIYYMAVNDNYCLYRYNLFDKNITKITSERVDTFNVYGDIIFYQRNENPALIRVNADGSNAELIAEGNYSNINCTSAYTFFAPFNDDATTFMVPTSGPAYVSQFNPSED